MRPHPKTITQPTLPPALEQAIRDARALLAAVPQLVADKDGDDLHLSTQQLLASPEPQVFGTLYTDDAQGQAIADLVLRGPSLLETLLGFIEVPEQAAVPKTERAPRKRRDPKAPPAPVTPPPAAAPQAAAPADRALEVAHADPTQCPAPGPGWTEVTCLCGRDFWYPPIRKVGLIRCYQCLGNLNRTSRLELLHQHLPSA